MKLWNLFLRKKKEELNHPIPSNFRELAKLSIELIKWRGLL